MKMADEAVEISEIIILSSNNMYMVFSLLLHMLFIALYCRKNKSRPTRLSSNY